MKKNNLYTGIDIGAQIVRAVIGQIKPNDEVDVLGVGETPLLTDSFQANNEAVLFWNTNRGALPAPGHDWRKRLPGSLGRWLPVGQAV